MQQRVAPAEDPSEAHARRLSETSNSQKLGEGRCGMKKGLSAEHGQAGREGASSGGEEVAAELRQGTAAKASARNARTLSTSSTPVPLISAAAASEFCPRAERPRETKEASRVVVSQADKGNT